MLTNIELFSMQPIDVNPVVYQKGLSIKGQIKEGGNNIPCRVRLFNKLTGRIVRDITTDQHGNYEFDHLLHSIFFVVAHHPSSKFNAVIQDNVVPK
ncbi:carboxypeptidase regulatory-like domain-containing protein [Acinetobacter sp. ANC 5045]|uniref:carboxypeptidase regulatory-like domain-containing protein n=1 Tax=Acinetobacter sp. ANC 5045 TaxID=2529851 RepID=UPI0010407E58|nr:carboxypeptidase regulatory-like domain-containing protein [Acinetobacter sp. ANC 5045]TCB17313.1 carboxypeptidase regulatory-like domain-containing protein [Acinetobacter sp. ANC 5045]